MNFISTSISSVRSLDRAPLDRRTEGRAGQRYINAVAAHVASRLHPTGSESRCRCGSCRHQILVASRRSGIALRQLVAAMPREGKPEKKDDKLGRRRRRHTEPVVNTMTVTVHGRQTRGTEAVLALVGSA